MARVNPQLLRFNGGEIGGQALARVDVESYVATAERMLNILPTVQGTMAKAPGTEFIGQTPSNNPAVLRPFAFNEDQSFVLELSQNVLRWIYRDGYVTLPGAAATLGAWQDLSAAPSTGGGAPPTGGSTGVQDPSGDNSGGGWGYEDDGGFYMDLPGP